MEEEEEFSGAGLRWAWCGVVGETPVPVQPQWWWVQCLPALKPGQGLGSQYLGAPSDMTQWPVAGGEDLLYYP